MNSDNFEKIRRKSRFTGRSAAAEEEFGKTRFKRKYTGHLKHIRLKKVPKATLGLLNGDTDAGELHGKATPIQPARIKRRRR